MRLHCRDWMLQDHCVGDVSKAGSHRQRDRDRQQTACACRLLPGRCANAGRRLHLVLVGREGRELAHFRLRSTRASPSSRAAPGAPKAGRDHTTFTKLPALAHSTLGALGALSRGASGAPGRTAPSMGAQAQLYWCAATCTPPLLLVDGLWSVGAGGWRPLLARCHRLRPPSTLLARSLQRTLTPPLPVPRSLDASACALSSEDYTATTRWHFQRELVTVHSGAAARQPSAGVALVAAASGRASVALHPTTDAEALQVALQEVQPDGEANLEAALKLALVGAGWAGAATVRCLPLTHCLLPPLRAEVTMPPACVCSTQSYLLNPPCIAAPRLHPCAAGEPPLPRRPYPRDRLCGQQRRGGQPGTAPSCGRRAAPALCRCGSQPGRGSAVHQRGAWC